MKIADGIHLIASGNLGVNLTHPLDCNAFAVEYSEGVFLIDAGVGQDPRPQLPAGKITHLLLTHYHLDHAGGAYWLESHLPDLTVCCSPPTAQAVVNGDQQAISLTAAKRAGMYPNDFPFHPCPVSLVLQPNESLTLGDTTIQAIPTPGHSRDMYSYLVKQPDRTMLFPGDTFFHNGRIVVQDIWDCDVPAYATSLRRINTLEFDMLFPGHGLWSLANGRRHISAAMEYVNKLLLPPNLI